LQLYTITFKKEKMIKSRTIFIWDVQWCYDELKLLIEKLDLTKEDKVYFTWDLINRWPKSYKVLKYIYKNKDQFKSVLWNHEINFLRWLGWNPYEEDNEFIKLKNKIEEKNTQYLIDYIKDFPLYIKEKDFTLIHWWLIPGKKLKEHTIDEITRLREINWDLWYNQYTWNKKIIYWHNAVDWLQIREKTIWLDSWCCYWKSLTAYVLETWEIYSQTALNIYYNVYE